MQLYIQIGALMEKHGYTNQSMADVSGVPVGTVSERPANKTPY